MNFNGKKTVFSFSLVFVFLFSAAVEAQAQSGQGGSGTLMTTLLIIAIILAVIAIVSVADNFMQLEAQKGGIDTEKENFSIFPNFSELFSEKKPLVAGEEGYTKLKKGFDIQLEGEATGEIHSAKAVSRYGIRPADFVILPPIPKMTVTVGDEVKAGQVLFHDKKDDRIKFVAPVSGEIVDIVRGEKRAITDVVILADKEMTALQHEVPSIKEASRDELVQFMLESGAWTLLNKRPYDIIPSPDSLPRDIFISTFNTAPLSPDYNTVVSGREADFQTALNVLGRLTEGSVYLGLNAADENISDAFAKATSVKKHWFEGKHPAGNVGVQIHHIAGINSGDAVWTLDVQDAIALGSLFTTGKWDASRVVAVTGAELEAPQYLRTHAGAFIGDLLKGNLKDGNIRVIDGNVLTGAKSSVDGFLKHGSEQITVVAEGDDYELFGWLLPIEPRPTISNTFPNFLYPDHKFEANTNTHGEKRAFVMSGQYESVMPMDIYPQHLMKAIMAGDFERMEGLGINELSEEDVALCEFVCTSKMPLQEILRDGLEMMREQG